MRLGTLSINSKGNGFLLGGEPWFWLADTCWSAFTSITLEDWAYYLDRRAEQGFNVVQVNTLPQWDRCRPDLGIYPYASTDGTVFDWNCPNPAYWERVHTMCAMAAERGMRMALVVLWCSFVPGTWGEHVMERNGATCMPREEVAPHIARVLEAAGEFDPVLFVSGDTDFRFERAIDFYEYALDEVVRQAPGLLRSMHIVRGIDELPERYLDRLDFYTFQSGHNAAEQAKSYTLAEAFAERYPGKPLINAEPCYEQMGASHLVYRRFDEGDARAAAWSSILSGACAGVTYGAHGVWNWQTSRTEASMLGEGFDAPFRWYEAMQFPGAWSYGQIREVVEHLALRAAERGEVMTCEPVGVERPEIRAAWFGDTALVYLPFPTSFVVPARSGATGACRIKVLSCSDGHVAHLPAATVRLDGGVEVAQHPFAGDALIIIERMR